MISLEQIKKLTTLFKGDIEYSADILEKYSRDASMFVVYPDMVAYPMDTQDVQALVMFAHTHHMTITARAAGTCMSGGAVNTGIIMDTTRYMNHILEITDEYVRMQPGVYYRDLEIETLKRNRVMPAYTASKHLCAVGGMFGNNCAGEKTLKYGKMENYVLSTRAVFTDGCEYVVRPLTKTELYQKIYQGDFEGNVYKQIWELIQHNTDSIEREKPQVSKNSAGYYIWNVWNQDTGIFDLNKLLVGSQGTLGIVTEMTWSIVPVEPVSAMLVTFLPDLSRVGDLVKKNKTISPSSIESFDDYSLKLAFRFASDFIGQLGLFGALRLGLRFIPELFMMIRTGIPKLILMTEVTGNNQDELLQTLQGLRTDIKKEYGYISRVTYGAGAEKYWRIRRESFNLLRKHVQGLHTAPFIDDVVVPIEHLPEFLPQITQILEREKFIYTIAGHAGNGNFHIIPLMDFTQPETTETIRRVSDDVYTIVQKYHGSITGEHNDGLVRTQYLSYQYSTEMIDTFKKIKEIFDPIYMFNPEKKVIHDQNFHPLDYIVKK